MNDLHVFAAFSKLYKGYDDAFYLSVAVVISPLPNYNKTLTCCLHIDPGASFIFVPSFNISCL